MRGPAFGMFDFGGVWCEMLSADRDEGPGFWYV